LGRGRKRGCFGPKADIGSPQPRVQTHAFPIPGSDEGKEKKKTAVSRERTKGAALCTDQM